MAKIERKLQDIKNSVGELQTTFQWTVEIMADGSNSLVDKTKTFKWRLESVGGISAPEVSLIDISTNGFTIPFYGKINKRGQITLNNVYEDINGTVGKFYRDLMRSYYKGSNSAKTVDAMENISEKYTNEMRWKVKVSLGDNKGNVTRVWYFFNALITPEFSLDLNQEANPVSYNFKVEYSTFTESDGNEGDAW